MNEWEITMKKPGVVKSDSGTVSGDAFRDLVKDPPGSLRARVAMSYSLGLDYGVQKVSATVTLECDQRVASIDKAGELAYNKAYELVQDGWSWLNATVPG